MSEEQPAVEPSSFEFVTVINKLADRVLDAQKKIGFWGDSEDDEDPNMGVFVSELHLNISHILQAYQDGLHINEISYIDPEGGGIVGPGEGLPGGIPIEACEIMFKLIGLLKRSGVDVAKVMFDVLVAQRVLAEQAEVMNQSAEEE